MTWVNGATTVTITTAGYPLKTEWTTKQNRMKFEDGSVAVYDRDRWQVFYTFNIRLKNSTHAALRDFIRSTLTYRYNTFTLTPDAGIDLGLGDGVAVTARYWDSNLMEDWSKYNTQDFQVKIRLEL